MVMSDWNMDANEEKGQQEALKQPLCDICGLPASAHRWQQGKMGAAGYCLFAPGA
jgi:hypothetical protein